MKKPKVMVCVPTGDKWIHASVVTALLGIMKDDRFNLSVGFFSAIPSEYCRNQIAKMARDSDVDYLLMIDDDNPPSRNPLDLVSLDLDVVGLPTPMWKTPLPTKEVEGHTLAAPIAWNVSQKKAKADKYTFSVRAGSGLEEVDVIGSGCLLIARRVLDDPAMRAPFMRLWDEDGMVVQGSDLHFCDRVRAAGYKVWCHWDYPCAHFKTIDLADAQRVVRTPLEQLRAAVGADKEVEAPA